MTDDHEHDEPVGRDRGTGGRDGGGRPGANRNAGQGEYVWPRERVTPQYVDAGEEPEDGGRRASGGGRRRAGRRRAGRHNASQESRRRRRRGTLFALVGLVVLAAIAFVGGKALLGNVFDTAPDYDGTGDEGVVVQVASGDTTTQIAQTLKDRDVVKSVQAFLDAASGNAAMSVIHPGYVQVKTHMSADSAVSALTSEDSRVGGVVIPEGRQLADIHAVSGQVTPGVLSLVADASCMDDAGTRTCITVDQLSDALADSDPAELGVPEWALDRVREVPDPERRYEGLIKAGRWNFNPTDDPAQVLRELFTDSATAFESQGILDAGSRTGLSPYDTLVAASLIEREAPPDDFPKVSRVILNRLDEGQMLQFDSTVNYSLDRQEVATTDSDRERETPWNTYAMDGLPATPISAPGDKALQAAENPATGDWLYFVTVSKNGTTVFTDNYDEHLDNIRQAQAAGVLDSGR